MKVEVKVVSKEIIKPSSPTPSHLRSYQLSFLDQISPPVYNPCVTFYNSSELYSNDSNFNVSKLSLKLKKSLSDVLTLYYPLAGRVKDNLNIIDCNDEGIPYSEAQVLNCQLSEFIQNPVPSELNKFIPFALDDVSDFALSVQVNVFDCGGIAVGSCVSHKIADALSSFMFLKSWAAITRGVEPDLVPHPQFISATLFPPKNIFGYNPSVGITSKNGSTVVSKRFVFSASAIEAIRAKYDIRGKDLLENQKRPSRVEALSAFIWCRFMASTQVNSAGAISEKIYAIVHAVNLRTRIEPPLPESSFGNLYRIAMTIPCFESGQDLETNNICGVVKQMRDQISQVDKAYVKKLGEGLEHLNFIKERAQEFTKGEMVSLNFTSLCRFPLYEFDYGWGKPTWVGSPPPTFKNLVVFMDTKSGDGVEAYINLEEDHMAKFESDYEFLAFVSPHSKT